MPIVFVLSYHQPKCSDRLPCERVCLGRQQYEKPLLCVQDSVSQKNKKYFELITQRPVLVKMAGWVNGVMPTSMTRLKLQLYYETVTWRTT